MSGNGRGRSGSEDSEGSFVVRSRSDSQYSAASGDSEEEISPWDKALLGISELNDLEARLNTALDTANTAGSKAKSNSFVHVYVDDVKSKHISNNQEYLKSLSNLKDQMRVLVFAKYFDATTYVTEEDKSDIAKFKKNVSESLETLSPVLKKDLSDFISTELMYGISVSYYMGSNNPIFKFNDELEGALSVQDPLIKFLLEQPNFVGSVKNVSYNVVPVLPSIDPEIFNSAIIALSKYRMAVAEYFLLRNEGAREKLTDLEKKILESQSLAKIPIQMQDGTNLTIEKAIEGGQKNRLAITPYVSPERKSEHQHPTASL